MLRVIGYILLFGAIVVAIKIAIAVAIMFAIVLGLLSRPKETIGLLVLLLVWNLIHYRPVLGLTVLGILIAAAILLPTRKSDPEATEQADSDESPG